MMKSKLFIALLVIAFIGIGFRSQIITHTKAFLLISEEFPQIPVKPLGLITKTPAHRTLEFGTDNGKVVADLFLPGRRSTPAVILAMGVRTQEKDKPVILHFAQTMSRLGYVVLWPRLEILDKGVPSFEEPETFVESFEFLENNEAVDPERISFIGFSVGSSVAMVAAQNPRIAERVHALVFFGGYYDAFDYIASLITKKAILDSQEILWSPADGATGYIKEILEREDAKNLLGLFQDSNLTTSYTMAQNLIGKVPESELLILEKLNPSQNVGGFRARIFILHDKKDSYVPYAESIKLSRALPGDLPQTFLLSNLFEHVQPQKGLSPKIVGELSRLYRFLYQILSYL